jgi:hypothetical protein
VATLRIKLTVPSALVKEPVIYKTCKLHRLVPNIRKARITEASGETILDLNGDEGDLQAGVEYLTGLGVEVTPVTG